MGANDIIIQGLIDIHLAGKGGPEAVSIMKEVVAQAKQIKTETSSLGEGMGRAAKEAGFLNEQVGTIGRTIVGWFAVERVADFLRDSYLEFAKIERSTRVIENQIKSLGQTAEAGQFHEFIDGLSRQTGILDNALIPAFQRAITTYRDYTVATQAVTIASRFAAAGIGDVGSNVEAFTQFFQTGRAQALKPFISDLKGAEDGTISWAEVIPQLQRALEGLGKPLEDAQGRVDEAKRQLSELGQIAGHALDVGLTKFERFGLILKELGKQDARHLPSLAAAIKAVDDAAEQARVDALFAADDRIDEFAISNARRDAEREEVKNRSKILAAEKAEREKLQKIEALDTASEQAKLSAQLGVLRSGSAARIELELDLLDVQKAAAIANVVAIQGITRAEIAHSVDVISRQFAVVRGIIATSQTLTPEPTPLGPLIPKDPAEEQAILTKIARDGTIERLQIIRDLTLEGTQERLDVEADLQKAQLERSYLDARDSAEFSNAALLQLEQQKADKIKAIDNQTLRWKAEAAAQETDIIIQAASETGHALNQAFGKSKGVAIGLAIMDTSTAIMGLWAQGSRSGEKWYVTLAKTIAMAAIGLANIQSIRSATPDGGGHVSGGGGGGAAASPSFARSGDGEAPPAFTTGSGVDAATIAGRAVAGGRSVVVNIGNAFGDRDSMTKLSREIARVFENDPSRLR